LAFGISSKHVNKQSIEFNLKLSQDIHDSAGYLDFVNVYLNKFKVNMKNLNRQTPRDTRTQKWNEVMQRLGKQTSTQVQ
jgi:hypothetical protein